MLAITSKSAPFTCFEYVLRDRHGHGLWPTRTDHVEVSEDETRFLGISFPLPGGDYHTPDGQPFWLYSEDLSRPAKDVFADLKRDLIPEGPDRTREEVIADLIIAASELGFERLPVISE